MDCFACPISDWTARYVLERQRRWCITDNAKKSTYEFFVGGYASGFVEKASKRPSKPGVIVVADYEGGSSEVRPENPSSIVNQALDKVVSEYRLPQSLTRRQEHPSGNGNQCSHSTFFCEGAISLNKTCIQVGLGMSVGLVHKCFESRRVVLATHVRWIRNNGIVLLCQ